MYIPKTTGSSVIGGLKLKTSNLADLSYLITVAANGNLDENMLSEWIDQRLLTTDSGKSDKEELETIHTGIRSLYDVLVEIISRKKWEAYLNQGKAIDMNQPKYKISVAAQILKVERATVNNWTRNKGGYIRFFEQEGISKFILEADIKSKYKEITGTDLVIDEVFREKYQYKVNLK